MSRQDMENGIMFYDPDTTEQELAGMTDAEVKARFNELDAAVNGAWATPSNEWNDLMENHYTHCI